MALNEAATIPEEFVAASAAMDLCVMDGMS